jgi:uncharacterized protein YkwD
MRRAAVLALLIGLVCVAFAPGTARPSAQTPSVMNALEEGVITELNGVRAKHGLAPLRTNGALGAAALGHSNEMIAKGYFAHESADGSEFWKRIRKYYAEPNYGTWTVGENILWSTPGISPKKAVEMWMSSPGHRKNILSASWREIGIGAASGAGAGEFGGRQITVITTDFGSRR